MADQRHACTTSIHHKPADQFGPTWKLTGTAQHAELYYRVGQPLAAEATFTQWCAGLELRAARELSKDGK